MSDYDFQLEINTYIEAQKMIRRDATQAPSRGFLDAVKKLGETQLQLPGTPVSPSELGWDKVE